MLTLLERRPREPAGDYAFRVLHHNILHLFLKPGQPINESALSQILGVSRTPVREALSYLSRLRLVDVLPQRGSRVSLIDTSLIDEAKRARYILESAMTETACGLATQKDLQELENNLYMQKFYLEQENYEQLIELDNAFHAAIFRIARSGRIYEAMSRLLGQYNIMRCLCLQSLSAPHAVAEHELILEAFKSRNAQVAVREIQNHVARYKADEQRILEDCPQYFLPCAEEDGR